MVSFERGNCFIIKEHYDMEKKNRTVWCFRDISGVLDTFTTSELCDSCNFLLTTEQLHKHTISECDIAEHHSSTALVSISVP